MTVKENSVFADTSALNFEPGSWQESLYDIYVGLYIGFSHVAYFVVRAISRVVGLPTEKQRISSGESENVGLKVVGVGYGRTGTYSLAMALEELGFPTLHTQHLYENDEIFAMWANTIFQPSIDNHVAFMGGPDFDLVAKHGFQATMDLPAALYFEDLSERYPDCKFILTTRENSEVWFRSWDTLTKSIVHPARYGGLFFANVNRIFLYLRWLFSIVNKDDSYLTVPFPLPDQNKAQAIASYEAHNKRVREVIPANRLLEYSVKEGWEPLCEFLNIQECPTKPFPKSNSARSIQAQGTGAFTALMALILFVLFASVAYIFKCATGKTVLGWVSEKYYSAIHRWSQQKKRD